MDWIFVTGITFLAIDYFIIFPILSYHLYIFHKTGKSTTNQTIHRSKTLVHIINIFILFAVLIERTFLVCSRILLISNKQNNIPDWLVYIISSSTWNFIMILFIIKVYHLYYKQNYNVAIANLAWTTEINPNDRDWYIANKQTFGNTIYCIKIGMIPYILSISIQTIIPYLLSDASIYFMLNALITSILFLVALYTFYKTKSMIDIYGIRNELFYQCTGSAISSFLYLLITLLFLGMNQSDELNRIEWLLQIPISYIIIISIGLISTIYPVWFIKRKAMATQLLSIIDYASAMSTSDTDTNETMEYIKNSKAMEHIISDYQWFRVFMKHLITEFSTENLLFLVELVQLKYTFQVENNNVIRVPRKNLTQPKYYNVFDFVYTRDRGLSAPSPATPTTPQTPTLQSNYTVPAAPYAVPSLQDAKSSNKNDNSRYIVLDFTPRLEGQQNKSTLYTCLFQTDNIVHTKLSIPSKLPKSAILINHDNLLDQMKALYLKYIRSGSLNEINLSYSVRNSVAQFFEHSTVKLNEIKVKEQYYKLFNVLDECGIEIILLMTQSFQRFIKSDKMNKTLLEQLVNKGLIDAKINNTNNIDVVKLRNADSFSKIKKQRTYIE